MDGRWICLALIQEVFRAPTSSADPWATSRSWPFFTWVSYSSTLFLGMPALSVRRQRAEPAHHHGTFERGDDPDNDWSSRQHGPNARDPEERGTE